jgi:hypothetical protein
VGSDSAVSLRQWEPIMGHIETAGSYPAVSLRPQILNFANDYLNFLCVFKTRMKKVKITLKYLIGQWELIFMPR